MDENKFPLESTQKNPFRINCDFCKKKADEMRNEKEYHNEIVHGYGDKNAKIVLVGEGPGRNGATITGIPFTKDESGKRVQIGLIKSGYSEGKKEEVIKNKFYIPKLRNVFITNIYRFYGYNKVKGNDKVTIRNDAINHLKEEISNLKKINEIKIIPLGKNSQKALIKLNFIESNDYLYHPSTKNPKTRKTREQWVNMFVNYLKNST